MESKRDFVNVIAAVLVFLMGVFGILCNFLILVAFKKEKADRTSFNLICVFRAVINLYVLITTFMVCFLPIIILGESPFTEISPYFEAALIVFSNTFYLGNEYQTILVAANRFCALFFPLHYARLFGYRSTFTALILIYGYRFFALFFDAFFYAEEEQVKNADNNCTIFFSPEKLTWTLTDGCDPEDNILAVVSITFLIVTVFNVATFMKIVKFQRASKIEGKRISSAERKNMMLFLQTVLQDSLYLVDLTFTFKLSSLSQARAWSFISGTFVWECLHSFDGMIMLLFNERFSFVKSLIRRLQPSAPVSESPQTTAPMPMARVE